MTSYIFDNVRLPVDVENGASGGPAFNTTLMQLGSGAELRQENWKYPRHSWELGYGMQHIEADELNAVRAFFYQRHGRSRPFLFKDWSDFKAVDMPIPYTGTGVINVALSKSYGTGDTAFVRPITRPVTSTLQFKLNGTAIGYGTCIAGLANVNVTGGGALTASFEFDVPVRFDTDQFTLTMENIIAGDIGSLPVVEVLENSWTLNNLPIPV